jgi:putative membrane protein
VRARDDRRRIELQAAQRARRREQLGRVGTPAPAHEPLVADREPADGGGGHAQHRAKIRPMAAKPPLRDEGREPDPRFTFANERTYLAWNRTGLALVGGGLAAGQLLDFDSRLVRLCVALPPVLLGAAIIADSYRRWEANERAIRRGEPLPRYGPPRAFAYALTALALGIAVLVVVEAL